MHIGKPGKYAGNFSTAVLRRLIGEYRHDKALVVVASVISLLASVGELGPGLIFRYALNRLQDWLQTGQIVVAGLWLLAGLLLAIAVAQALLSFSQTLLQARLSARITNRFRERMYAAIQRHSLKYHKQTTTGDLIARSTRDINSVSRFINFAVFGSADLLIFLVGAIVILFWINPVFAAIALSPVPIAMYLTIRFSASMRGRWRGASEKYAETTTVLQENIAGARVVRAFAQEPGEIRKFAAKTTAYVKEIVDVFRFWVLRSIAANFIFSLVMPISLAYGAYAVIQGTIKVGDVYLYFAFMRTVQQRLWRIINMVEMYQNASAGADRVFEILDAEPDIRSKPRALPVPPSPSGAGAEVEFRHISFGYQPEKLVLRDVSLLVKPGQTIGIVGATGSGKSTLISMIPRFHDPVSGALLLNGIDLRDIGLQPLRRAVGIIFQETFLFSATVRENIAYGQPDASLDTVRAAAEAAAAHDFILALEDGYDTVIGERGVTLSGGQAQRIAIARAVLLDPKVLIMDDATASVDSETERQIRETMRRVALGRTNFIIAHRISSVAHADRIIVLSDGRIAEQGTHAELTALGGIYRRMCDQQFAGQTDDA